MKPQDVTIVALTTIYDKKTAPVWLTYIITLVYNSYILRIFKKEKLNAENL